MERFFYEAMKREFPPPPPVQHTERELEPHERLRFTNETNA